MQDRCNQGYRDGLEVAVAHTDEFWTALCELEPSVKYVAHSFDRLKAETLALQPSDAARSRERELLQAMWCGHKLADGRCEALVVPDSASYSGYSHLHQLDSHGQRIDWLHWAFPFPQIEAFALCAVCGKTGPDNQAHIRYDGHPFRAAELRSGLRELAEGEGKK